MYWQVYHYFRMGEQRGATHVNITNIQMKTRKTIETFIIESAYDLAPPPMEVQTNGLYVLLS